MRSDHSLRGKEVNMPRQKLARRFVPRYGVSQGMLDAECVWVGRELEDTLLSSLTDLRQKLKDLQARIGHAEVELEAMIGALPDRERLAIRCMLARDFYHIAMLYRSFLSTSPLAQAMGSRSVVPEEQTQGDPLPVLSFQKSL